MLKQWGKFHLLLNSAAIVSHSSSESGALIKHFSLRTVHNVWQVSEIILPIVVGLILYLASIAVWESPVAKYRKVTQSLSAGVVVDLRNEDFWIIGATQESKSSNVLVSILKFLKKYSLSNNCRITLNVTFGIARDLYRRLKDVVYENYGQAIGNHVITCAKTAV